MIDDLSTAFFTLPCHASWHGRLLPRGCVAQSNLRGPLIVQLDKTAIFCAMKTKSKYIQIIINWVLTTRQSYDKLLPVALPTKYSALVFLPESELCLPTGV